MRTVYLVAGICLVVLSSRAAAQRDEFAAARRRMVDEFIAGEGVKNPRVIDAMLQTPRHEFVADLRLRRMAYFDMALPIGSGQTISPPYIVAYMTEQLDPQPTDKVLEIGTGSGYQAAVLSPLAAEVYTIEIVESLGRRATETLRRLGYRNVHVKIGDGYLGWPEHAPFDKIIVTCSPEKVPQPLVDQLKEGGRLLIPLGERYQQTLYLFTKREGRLEQTALLPVVFVPMMGKAEDTREVRPDPRRPQLINGSFEELLPESGKPSGWYYLRQFAIESPRAVEVPDGLRFATLRNEEAGRYAQAIQAFAVDGRYVRRLHVAYQVRGENLIPGPGRDELAAVVITFFDESRREIGTEVLGTYRGTFNWREVSVQVSVPREAREAIFRLAMHGATGAISFDHVRLGNPADNPVP
jgi:protein-L-isoaspartate(D-aspartate) O-methyltransferase